VPTLPTSPTPLRRRRPLLLRRPCVGPALVSLHGGFHWDGKKKDLTSGSHPDFTKIPLIVWFVYFWPWLHVCCARQPDSGPLLSEIISIWINLTISAHWNDFVQNRWIFTFYWISMVLSISHANVVGFFLEFSHRHRMFTPSKTPTKAWSTKKTQHAHIPQSLCYFNSLTSGKNVLKVCSWTLLSSLPACSRWRSTNGLKWCTREHQQMTRVFDSQGTWRRYPHGWEGYTYLWGSPRSESSPSVLHFVWWVSSRSNLLLHLHR
jgi:hypothetical protein